MNFLHLRSETELEHSRKLVPFSLQLNQGWGRPLMLQVRVMYSTVGQSSCEKAKGDEHDLRKEPGQEPAPLPSLQYSTYATGIIYA